MQQNFQEIETLTTNPECIYDFKETHFHTQICSSAKSFHCIICCHSVSESLTFFKQNYRDEMNILFQIALFYRIILPFIFISKDYFSKSIFLQCCYNNDPSAQRSEAFLLQYSFLYILPIICTSVKTIKLSIYYHCDYSLIIRKEGSYPSLLCLSKANQSGDFRLHTSMDVLRTTGVYIDNARISLVQNGSTTGHS